MSILGKYDRNEAIGMSGREKEVDREKGHTLYSWMRFYHFMLYSDHMTKIAEIKEC